MHFFPFQLDVLDRELSKKEFIIGDEYTIADVSIWPWYGRLVLGQQYGAPDFLQVSVSAVGVTTYHMYTSIGVGHVMLFAL